MNRTIKDLIATLPANDRLRLMVCFDHGIPQFVDLGDGTFVGVHIQDSMKGLLIMQRAGSWSAGTLNGQPKDKS